MEEAWKQRIRDLSESGDQLFEGFFEWLGGQYDPATGGFYYARSSVDSGEFEPDIESKRRFSRNSSAFRRNRLGPLIRRHRLTEGSSKAEAPDVIPAAQISFDNDNA